jgi:hypothetical protein
MTQPAKASPKAPEPVPVIVYGVGSDDRPIAAQFPGQQSILAIKAASQLKLNVLKVTTDEIGALAKRLPPGRINAAGKGLVPAVRKPLYDEVLKAAGVPSSQTTAAAGTTAGSASPANAAKVPMNEVGKTNSAVGSTGLPTNWKDIKPGQLVIVQESNEAGWGECIVVDRKLDILEVRWKSSQKWPPFKVHVDAVALLNPAPDFKV